MFVAAHPHAREQRASYCLSKGEENTAPISGKEVVFVIGNTGAGKSTSRRSVTSLELLVASFGSLS